MPYVAVLKMKMVASISSQHRRGSSGSSADRAAEATAAKAAEATTAIQIEESIVGKQLKANAMQQLSASKGT